MIAAFDPGNSNSKGCINGEFAMIPSAISRPKDIGHAGMGMKAATQVDIVETGGAKYAVGPGAWEHGDILGVLDYYSLASPERRALMEATFAAILPPGEHQITKLLYVMPVPLLRDKNQADSVKARLKSFKGEHHFRINAQEYLLHIERIQVLAQPVGAYADWVLDDELHQRSGTAKQKVAICDVGGGTLDLYVLQEGRPIPKNIGGGKFGVRRLLELLNANGRDLQELDHDLRTGHLRPTKAQLETWLDEILDCMEPVWKDLRHFDVVIPVGGGAALLGDLLRLALIAKGGYVHWPEDPIFTNVIGAWKWGVHGQ